VFETDPQHVQQLSKVLVSQPASEEAHIRDPTTIFESSRVPE